MTYFLCVLAVTRSNIRIKISDHLHWLSNQVFVALRFKSLLEYYVRRMNITSCYYTRRVSLRYSS